MSEHTYTAPRLHTALARVKRELGSDASILSSRQLAGGEFEVRARAPEGYASTRREATPSLLERLLSRSGLAKELIELLSEDAGDTQTLAGAQNALTEAIHSRITFEAPNLDTGRRVVALVGPTGVGKTTTLAKLAADTALVRRRAVGMITLDEYRIGAAAQIQLYADLIGIPLEIARDRQSFERAMRRLADAEVIFLDTAGRAPRDRGAQAALAEILHLSGTEVNVTLCIAAATRSDELQGLIERHNVLRPKSITITKSDETQRHDATVAAPMLSGLPLAWMTTGQRVPEDVERATAPGLAALLCGLEESE